MNKQLPTIELSDDGLSMTIISLTYEYDNFFDLTKYPQVERLLLEGNFTILPDLSCLVNLKELNCSGWGIEQIGLLPDSLEYLKIWTNKLQSIPDISYLTNLKYLDCDDNNITEIAGLPQSLEVLSCNTNDFQMIPDLTNCHNLVRLEIDDEFYDNDGELRVEYSLEIQKILNNEDLTIQEKIKALDEAGLMQRNNDFVLK